MKDPNAIVSGTIRFHPPLKGTPAEMLRDHPDLSVELEGDRRVRFNPEDPRSVGFIQILDGLNRQRMPVYLELEPNTSVITRLLIPHVTHIAGFRRSDDKTGLYIELEYSHGRHLLKYDFENYADLKNVIDRAIQCGEPVILTEDDAHIIIDVRFFKPGPDGPFSPPKLPKPLPWPLKWFRDLLRWIWMWPWWLWWWFRCISAGRAQQVFNAMNSTSCDPLTVPVPCIPFLYPDDGCWGRAHEMCRLMKGMGLSSKKVWIQGSLYVNTQNNPNCYVQWGWHVAPTLCVRGPGFFQHQEMVIDPSLFTTPVSQSTWKGVQGDPGATLTSSDSSIFYLWGNVTDQSYTATNNVLATYRLQLLNRALNFGPPPYANCP
jgi:hypothetical protein